MGWARFDDCYTDHPKIVAAGPWCELLDMRAILYCARFETDGEVPSAALSRLGVGIPNAKSRARKLVEVGRWSATATGWRVSDFLEYHPSRAEQEEKRATQHDAKVQAGRIGGLRSGEARRSKREAACLDSASVSVEANGKQNEAPTRTPIDNSSLDSLTRSHPQAVGNPDCPRCQGRGTIYHAAAGRDAPCPCTRVEELSA